LAVAVPVLKASVMKNRWMMAALAGLLLCSCSLFKNEVKTEPADELAVSGMEEYDQKNYKEALAKFEKLKDWYPFSSYVVMAELKIADSHYYLKEYDQAIASYQSFAELHPSNEAIPYVFYQIGRCYYDRIDAVDRDQSSTQKALETFQRLQKLYPDSTYASRSTDHINDCLQRLTRSEFLIGFYYYQRGRYKAAINRFKDLIRNYPDVGVHQEALRYIAKCEANLATR
jgi:outer membrane protein assembly factor BamD